MSTPLRCIISAFLVAVAVCAAIGTLQYVRSEYYLSTQHIWQEGTTRPDQLTESFARRFSVGHYLNLGNHLADAQRDRFWLGNWSALGRSWLDWPLEWITIIAGLVCVFALGPVLAAATEPRFRRAFATENRLNRRSALSTVRWQTVRHGSWLVICCTPIALWLLIDREATSFEFDLLPRFRFGPLRVAGAFLPVAIGAYWCIGLARIFSRRETLKRYGNAGLCPACGYDCTGQTRCSECGLPVGSASNSKDRRTVLLLTAAFCIAVGVLALLPGSSGSLGMSWLHFQGHRPVPSMIFARPSEVLEIRCGDETLFVAWRVEFLPTSGQQAVPDSVVSAVMKLGRDGDITADVRVERALTSASVSSMYITYYLNIPSSHAQLRSPVGMMDLRQRDAFADSMVMFEFSCVSEVRRWDPGSDDPRIQRVVAALESVPPGTNLKSTPEERDRADE
jgi:hypothetical protein